MLQNENFLNNQIPLILYKTGPENIITDEEILKIFENNKKKLNIERILYYNDQNCIDFIKKTGNKYYKAYNTLIPNAFKSDLWRYSILYHNGGIYGDLTQEFLIKYNVNKYNVDMVLVKDRNEKDIQISFMACKKHNGFFKYLIDDITENILLKRKGRNVLDITGPAACGRNFMKFFSRSNIPFGIHNLKGLDNKYYKIRIDMYQTTRSFTNYNNKKKVVITKIRKHDHIITKKGKQPKYWILYRKNKIFR